MTIFGRHARQELDLLVEDFVVTRISRREFFYRATAAGLSLSAASSLLAACNENPGTHTNSNKSTHVQSIETLTVWSGEELDSFLQINAAFTKKTGIGVISETTRDINAVLATRLKGNNPPDVCGMPSVSTFHQLASQNKLLRLDTFLDMGQFQKNYAQTWIDYSSYRGGIYAILPKANAKNTIWYNPKAFKAIGASIPKTWNELIALSDKIAAQGKYPWSMGMNSGTASGWPAADWIDEIYINKYGPDMYDEWIAHQLPWTHPSVKDAFQLFGQIAHGKHYIKGGPQTILSTNFQDASYLPFDQPANAYMYYLGDFTAGFIKDQFKNSQSGKDFDFFAFPTINPKYKGSVVGTADLIAAFKDNDGTRQYMEFLSSAEAQSIWVKRGGATSINANVDLTSYPDDLARNAAKQMATASSLRVSADDLMPLIVENYYWQGALQYIENPKQLDNILATIEEIALQAYI
ncbi:alpha-glucoside ABC transporter substrate-binding protein [Dictyobacter alpinus]|uniref:Alpha-glucoside ABC transporter substrate-binding protein n=1 Tax=Dictyobacter alpinus TaxID=2014873 RepID=A0A402BC50_9CHLR|nr:extracellular solute-binding protein [Dictyobacter alpinus]GCE28872.1 alpha-glucoside ABC transporter substrate-binding protein [Dictyobacter alpinus]